MSEFLPKVAFRPPPETVFGGLKCLPGVVVVEIDLPEEKTEGGLYLPESVQEDWMPDVGTVVALDPLLGATGCLREGSRVLVAPKTGKSVEGFVRKGRSYDGFTRFYGLAGGYSPYAQTGDPAYSARAVPWSVCVMAVIEEDGTMLPTGDWIVLKHELQETTDGGVYLSGVRDPRTSVKGEIVSVGPSAMELSGCEGRSVVYHEGASRHIQGLGREFVMVREPFVYALVEE